MPKSNLNQGASMQNISDLGTLLTPHAQHKNYSVDDYQFQFNGNLPIDYELMNRFKHYAEAEQMTPETAQQLAHFYEEYLQYSVDNQMLGRKDLVHNLQCQCQQDAEFGGPRFKQNLAYAKAALDRFDNGNLAAILRDSGYGSHPDVIRFMYRVGKALSEKSMVHGGGHGHREPTAAELFYPSMKPSRR